MVPIMRVIHTEERSERSVLKSVLANRFDRFTLSGDLSAQLMAHNGLHCSSFFPLPKQGRTRKEVITVALRAGAKIPPSQPYSSLNVGKMVPIL